MAQMKVMQALAGMFPNKVDKAKRLEGQVSSAEALRTLISHEKWSAMSRIFDKFENEAVQELGTKGLEERDWLRINHRMELFADIRKEILSVIEAGNQAAIALNKMKEKNDGR